MIRGFLLVLFFAGFGLTRSLNAQDVETSASPARNNLLGIRISSSDAAVNHSITYKRFVSSEIALEGLLSFTDPGALGILVEKHTLLGSSGIQWFWGAGAYFGFSGGRRFGAHGAIGMDYIVPSLPLNFSLDWKPELNFTKQFSFEPAALGFSVRFVF
ncbi:hypothetical protein HRG84_10670 [Flavisolibacter sp. BT320]|nr:hypothetical protein [Flavisolibacter longurius]